MLEEYLNEQKIAYRILNNQINKNKISHAYLFVINGFNNYDNFIISFVKEILCPYKNTENRNCVNCTQCSNIDSNNFPELKKIYPDGFNIKKEQLEELQNEFSMKSIYASKKVYIIYNAERMNISSSNSILKFLEDPEENIIAILVTDNIHKMINTIVSRCQIIPLSNTKNKLLTFEEKLSYIYSSKIKEENNQDDFIENLEKIMEFINKFEEYGSDIIINYENLILDNFKDKDSLLIAFDTMIYYYRDIIRYKIGEKMELFEKFEIAISAISIKNNLKSLFNKIKTLKSLKRKVIVNANVNLILDKLIIELGRAVVYEK
ncbi:MAG: hypothetical protein ACK5HP_02060 [Bacilli bacterium]